MMTQIIHTTMDTHYPERYFINDLSWIFPLNQWFSIYPYMTIHCVISLIIFVLFLFKNKNIYSCTAFIIYIILQSLVCIHYENMQNALIYFVVAIHFCIVISVEPSKYDSTNKIQKIWAFIIYEPGLFIILFTSITLMVIFLKYFLEINGIICTPKPDLNIDIFLDYLYAFFFICIIVNYAFIFLSIFTPKPFVLQDYINCKYFLLGLLAISFGFFFKLYILLPILNIFFIQFINIEQYINGLNLKLRYNFLYLNELFINCIKNYNIRISIANYIRNNWVFHTWKFKNISCNIFKNNTRVNIGKWAPSMPKPIFLENKYMYFRDGCRYIKPTIFFEYVKKFSPENSYFTNLHLFNFTNNTCFTSSNSCLILANYCNDSIKSYINEINNFKVLNYIDIDSIKSYVNEINNFKVLNHVDIDLIKSFNCNKFTIPTVRLNFDNWAGNFINRNPNVVDNYDVRQAIKNIESLNYNIVLNLKLFFCWTIFAGEGIPITDYLSTILSVHDNKLRIGYIVAWRLATVTYDYPNTFLDIFPMEKFKQDYGHLFIIDYLYPYYPYIPYFDCCIVEEGKIIGHDVSPDLHKSNRLNYMLHTGQLDNTEHLSNFVNRFHGRNYYHVNEINMFLAINALDWDNHTFFRLFFQFYNLNDVHLGMPDTIESNEGDCNIKFFPTMDSPYYHMNVIHSGQPKIGYNWIISNMVDTGRNIFGDALVDDCYSIFTDGNKIIFTIYNNKTVCESYVEGSLQERPLLPIMAWRNFRNTNFVGLSMHNDMHIRMLNNLNIAMILTKDHDTFYDRYNLIRDIMSDLRIADTATNKYFWVADLHNINTSIYIDHTMRCLFNIPCPLGENKLRNPEYCEFIFKPNTGSTRPNNWEWINY